MTSAWVEGGGDSGLRRNRKNENTNDHFKGKSPPIPTPISMSFPRKREPPYSRQHICHSRESGNLKLHLSSNNNLLPRKLEPPCPRQHICHSRESGNHKLHIPSNNNLLPRKLESPYSHPNKYVIPAKAGTCESRNPKIFNIQNLIRTTHRDKGIYYFA